MEKSFTWLHEFQNDVPFFYGSFSHKRFSFPIKWVALIYQHAFVSGQVSVASNNEKKNKWFWCDEPYKNHYKKQKKKKSHEDPSLQH